MALHVDEQTANHLLVACGGGTQTLWHHVVDILEEDDIGIAVVEVLDECPMSGRAEEEVALSIAARRAIGVGSDGVGGGFLFRKSDLQ